MLKIDQSAFIGDLLKKENLSHYTSVSILIKAKSVIEINNVNNYKMTDIKAYQQLIGKLIYLLCGTRPNIVFTVGQLSRQNSDPKVDTLKSQSELSYTSQI